jgi:hypothetical protein
MEWLLDGKTTLEAFGWKRGFTAFDELKKRPSPRLDLMAGPDASED